MSSTLNIAPYRRSSRHSIFANAGEHEGKLQADQHKDQAVENEVERVPEAVGLQADRGGEEAGAAAAEIEAAGDHGEYAGGVDALGGQVGDVRDHDAEGDFDRAVVEVALDPFDDESDEEADGDANDDQVERRIRPARRWESGR